MLDGGYRVEDSGWSVCFLIWSHSSNASTPVKKTEKRISPPAGPQPPRKIRVQVTDKAKTKNLLDSIGCSYASAVEQFLAGPAGMENSASGLFDNGTAADAAIVNLRDCVLRNAPASCADWLPAWANDPDGRSYGRGLVICGGGGQLFRLCWGGGSLSVVFVSSLSPSWMNRFPRF